MTHHLAPPSVRPKPALPPPLWSAAVCPGLVATVALTGWAGNALCGPIGALLALPSLLAVLGTAKDPDLPWRPWAVLALGQALLVSCTALFAAWIFLRLSLAPAQAIGFALALACTPWLAALPTGPWARWVQAPWLVCTCAGAGVFLLLSVAHTLGLSHPLSLLAAPWALWAGVAGGAIVVIAMAHDDLQRHRPYDGAPWREACVAWSLTCLWTFAAAAVSVLAFPAMELAARPLPAAAAGLLAVIATGLAHPISHGLPHLAARTLRRVPEGEMEAVAEALATDLHASLAQAGWPPRTVERIALSPRGALFHPEKGEHVRVVVHTHRPPTVQEDQAIEAWKDRAQHALDAAWGRSVLVGGLDTVTADLLPSSAHHALQRAATLAALRPQDATPQDTPRTNPPRRGGMRRVA